MQRAVVSLPDGLDSQARWLLGELCAAAGLGVAGDAPALPLDPAWNLTRAGALLAREEELDSPVDEHGRFPAAASSLAAGAAPLDDLVLALREATVGARAGVPRGRALRRRADARHRHPVALEPAAACAARPRASRRALATRDVEHRAARGHGPGARAAASPVPQRPQLVAPPLRDGRAAARLPLDLLRARRAPRSARRRRARRPTPRDAPVSCSQLDRLGLEVGLHASYTCLADEQLLAEERAELAAPARRADRGQPSSLPAPALARRHPRARPARLLLRHDARPCGAPRAARRASRSRSGRGTSLRPRRCASSSSRSC